MAQQTALLETNYYGGAWKDSTASGTVEITDPATGEVHAQIGLAGPADVSAAVAAAVAAFPAWRRTPPQDRIQYLFRFRELLLKRADDIARTTTQENGKTFAEARAELARGIENVEVACGIPSLMQGYNLEDVASGIAGCHGGDHALQFSGHDSAVVSSLCDRDREHLYSEAF
jgi:malonate-semialdehyde dehydrogenase (acetylating)/methylmalonate-semialdehyde dehydrogenase